MVSKIRNEFSPKNNARNDCTFSSESENDESIDAQTSEASEHPDHQLYIDTSSDTSINYINKIFELVMQSMNDFQSNLQRPLNRNPLELLKYLQNAEYDLDPSSIPVQQSVLPIDIYLNIERNRKSKQESEREQKRKQNIDQGNSADANILGDRMFNLLCEFENIHNKVIFDAVNQALDSFRPYGLKGPPFPWSNVTRTLTYRNNRSNELPAVIQKVTKDVTEWTKTFAGTLPNSEMFRKGKTIQLDDDQLNEFREERLALVLAAEIEENEKLWVDYEYEEAQTKIDISDLIFETLVDEIVSIMAH